MKKIIIASALMMFTLNSIILSQIKLESHLLTVINCIPKWANNLSSINIGDYNNYVIQENPKEEIIGFISWGDREIGISARYKSFMYVMIDSKGTFLKFINTYRNGEHIIHKYEYGNLKITLDFDGKKVTASGNGNGGILKVYYGSKMIKTAKFWSSL